VDEGEAVRQVAPRLKVSLSYIYKVLGRRAASGEVTARRSGGTRAQKLAGHEAALLAQVRAQPDATLGELNAWLFETRGFSVSTGCLWNSLKRLGWTLKKSRSGPPSRSVPTSPRRAPPGRPRNRR